jgi:quercetin dioxygenase-like cupin family protein
MIAHWKQRRAGVAMAIGFAILLALMLVPMMSAAQTSPPAANPDVVRDVLGQIDSSISPGRTLLLAERSFPAGSDSGFHPAPGPVVLYISSGTVVYSVQEGVALYTPAGSTETQPILPGQSMTVYAGDTVTYDEGVVHDLKNDSSDEAVTLEARLNPIETPAPAATPSN